MDSHTNKDRVKNIRWFTEKACYVEYYDLNKYYSQTKNRLQTDKWIAQHHLILQAKAVMEWTIVSMSPKEIGLLENYESRHSPKRCILKTTMAAYVHKACRPRRVQHIWTKTCSRVSIDAPTHGIIQRILSEKWTNWVCLLRLRLLLLSKVGLLSTSTHHVSSHT